MSKQKPRSYFFRTRQSGTTLIELVVVTGIMGVIMLGISSQMVFSSRATNSVEKSLAFIDLVNQVEQFATDTTICTGALLGKPLPAAGDPAVLNFAGMDLDDVATSPGSNFQNGQIKITALKWAAVNVISTTKAIGYLSVQANLQGAAGNSTVVGGNYRNFPKPNSNPPGILFNMTTDPATHKITSCGGAASNGTDLYWSFTSACPWAGGNLGSCASSSNLPSAMPDANYELACAPVSINLSSGKQPTGVVVVTAKAAASFNFMVTTVMSNGQHNGQDNMSMTCHAHHN